VTAKQGSAAQALATAKVERTYRSYCLADDALRRCADAPRPVLRVAMVGDITLHPLVTCTRVALALRDVPASVWGGEPARLAEYVLAEQSPLYELHPDVIIFALTEATWLPGLQTGLLAMEEKARLAAVNTSFAQVEQWVATVLERTTASVFLQTVSPAQLSPLGLLDHQHAQGQHGLVERINCRLREFAARTGRLYVFDLDAVVRQHGAASAFDARMFALQQFPFSRAFTVTLGEAYGKTLRALRGAARKCVAVDLDNTLWGGIAGEDGPGGIVLGDTPTGRAFVAFQRTLLALRDRGVLLAVCSKNNPEDADEVLCRHPDMVLRPEHFAARRMNWQDKATNLMEIAAELNIGTDALVFVDDQPFERDLVRARLPEVLVVDLPADPAYYSQALLAVEEIETLVVTEDDRLRAQRYEEQGARETFRCAAGSLEDYLQGLEMRLQVVPADELFRARMLQLVQRTNQFNLTTRRYTDAEFRALVASPLCRVYGLRVADRFGDNGLVGVAIVRIAEGSWCLDSFLLSCRVLGRSIEEAFVQYIATEAKAAGARALVGQFIPTSKNSQVRDFYRRAGFTLVQEHPNGSTEWQLLLSDFVPHYPAWAVLS
jgi:FkbH-like protein